MELLYYISISQEIEILQREGYSYDDQDSPRSRRARLIVDALKAVEYSKQLEFNMDQIFMGVLHIRSYRKKYDSIIRSGRAKRRIAEEILRMAGVEPESRMERDIRLLTAEASEIR